MPSSTETLPVTFKKLETIVEISVPGKLIVSCGCKVKSVETPGLDGVVYKLHDPIDHRTVAINVAWFNGRSNAFSPEEFLKHCQITSTML